MNERGSRAAPHVARASSNTAYTLRGPAAYPCGLISANVRQGPVCREVTLLVVCSHVWEHGQKVS